MRFSRMTNNIRIENEIIYLPEMEIRSNVSNIYSSRASIRLTNQIDYRLQVPLKEFAADSPEERTSSKVPVRA
jgi:hypothetical protein